MLTNPIHSGAGRTGSRVRLEGGRKRVIHGVRSDRENRQMLIPAL